MKQIAIALVLAASAAAQGIPIYVETDQQDNQMLLVAGIFGHDLKVESNNLVIDDNNRTWMNNDVDIPYIHDYVASTFAVEVDLSAVECSCATGIYLVDTSQPGCDHTAKEASSQPLCSRIELMEANKFGFTTAVNACTDTSCPDEPQSRKQIGKKGKQYGPGRAYDIDSSKPFTVAAKFYALETEEGYGDVNRVEITLKQDGQSIVLDHDDSLLLAGLTENLRNDMALVVSNYDIGLDSEIQQGQCPRNSICGDYTSTLKNFQWTSDDSFVPDEVTTVADSLEDCENPDCTTCYQTQSISDPFEISYQCTDYRRMKYSNLCRNWKNKENLCGVDDICFRSWPETDPRKWRSQEAACRPLPEDLIEGEFKYAKRECRGRSNRGLCGLGCGEGETCTNSYPIDDPLKWKSPHAICRCKPDDI